MVKIKFKGEPLIPTPDFAQLSWNKFGKEVIARVNDKYKGTCAEIKPEYRGKNNQITHSNTFRLFAINTAAREFGARVIYPESSEILLAQKRLPEAESVYYDLGAVIDFSGQNHDLAVDLYNKLPKEQRDLDRFPAVALELMPVKSNIGGYGLSLAPTAHFQLRTAKILSQPTGNFDGNDAELLRSGLPLKLVEGNRKLYTTKQNNPSLDNLGVVRLCLGRGLYVDSDDEFLAGASEDGRVVVESAEGASKNFSGYYANLIQQRSIAESKLEKIKRAEEILKGK